MAGHMRIIPRHERAEARARDLEKVIRIIDGSTTTPATQHAGKQIGHRSAEGDQRRMRAIPVIAPAVIGTIPGTDPPAACIAKEQRTARTSTIAA